MPSIAELKVTDFEPRSGEVFRLRTDTQEIELFLVHVGHLGDSGREGGAFSLLFRSANGPFLPQAIYPIAHPALGTLEMFIVPIGPARWRQRLRGGIHLRTCDGRAGIKFGRTNPIATYAFVCNAIQPYVAF